MKVFRITTFFFLLFLGSFELNAAHIIGGEITYVCRGSGNYDFTMNLYRDCAGGGACFDSDRTCNRVSLDGHVTFFEGTRVLGTVLLNQPTITNIEPNLSNPCLIAPPNVCVEQGVYTFSYSLPLGVEDVTISYQRCCRNNTITNIVNARTSGSTYTTTLYGITRDSCNSSPTFNDFPPIVICRGEDVNFDHSATDVDGDSLVYSFCTPFLGGGWDGNNNTQVPTSAVNGLAPDPESAPPYTSVRWVNGFSALQPLNISRDREEPAVNINAETGLISGFPGNLGQYVVGVCVQAYRNGQLINEVRRDFQFNIADCENDLKVDVEETELREKNGRELFYIRICGDGTIINESTNQTYINEVEWNFDLPGGQKTISSKFDPDDLEFPGEGPYDGILVLNPGLPQCTDTGWVQVEIYPEIVADFEFEYDTCVGGPVEFTNTSYSLAGPDAIIELKWELDTSTLFDKDIDYQFAEAGTYDVLLTARDFNECTEEIEKTVEYLPIPPVLVIAPSAEESCLPATIFFENLSNPINEDYDIEWDFGDGNFGNGVSPTHTYESVGTFPISLRVTSPFGCEIDTSFGDLITTLPSPTADFTFSPERVSRLDPVVTFTDLSLDAIRWDWLFSGFGISREPSPVYTFQSSGIQEIRLIVTSQNSCQDTIFSFLDVIPDIAYTLPNAFTPNGDGINDTYFGVGNAGDADQFYLSIWNRYGELIFETEDADAQWNGRKNNVGKDAPNGVYVVKVRYVNYNGEVTNLQGFVTVIR